MADSWCRSLPLPMPGQPRRQRARNSPWPRATVSRAVSWSRLLTHPGISRHSLILPTHRLILRAPQRHGHQPRRDQLKTPEEPLDLLPRAHRHRRWRPFVQLLVAAPDIPLSIGTRVRDHQVAPRRQHVAAKSHSGVRIVRIRYEVQDSHQQERHGPVEIDQVTNGGIIKNDARISKICFNYRRPRDIRQNCATVRYSDRIIVDIHHVRLRVLVLSYLVHISRGGNPRADVDELSYSLADQVPHSPAHEIPIRLHHERKLRPKTNSLLRHPPVHLEIMRTTQVVVIHSGSARA